MTIEGFEKVSIDDVPPVQTLTSIQRPNTSWPPATRPDGRQSTLITRKCAEEDCEQMLCHYSKTGKWNYPGAKCARHSGVKSQ